MTETTPASDEPDANELDRLGDEEWAQHRPEAPETDPADTDHPAGQQQADENTEDEPPG